MYSYTLLVLAPYNAYYTAIIIECVGRITLFLFDCRVNVVVAVVVVVVVVLTPINTNVS